MNPSLNIEKVIQLEKESLEKDGDVIPKIFAFDQDRRPYVFFLKWEEGADKQAMFRRVGTTISNIFGDAKKELQELILVADTFLSRVDQNKKYEGELAVLAEKLVKGEIAPSQIPEKYKKEFQREALILTVSDKHANGSMYMARHTQQGKKIVFEEVEKMEGEFQDNLLSAVWWGYIYPSKDMDQLTTIKL